eukprot:CAMPEP_0116036008 /NCGR_PEP_ID=MMETSP0321-20121206/20828_1 /TAXON_ID=163516 /ORGANISM="Leptocylindrus danicus var. danicus, Strain B650" /LENGTH=342 /DNA_ID=CAMNT_0003513191 /DNA_START=294 /DNA_END=1322 /DNA_ORIENTATION=-
MARNLYIHLLKTHPWKTNLTSAGVLMIGGDSMAQYIEHNPSVGDDFKSWLKSWKVDLADDGDERGSTHTNQNRGVVDQIPDRHFDNDEDVDKDEMLPATAARKKGKPAVKLRRMMTLDMRKYHHDRIEDRTKCDDVDPPDEPKSSNTSSKSDFQLDKTRICSMMGWSVGIHAPSWIAIFRYFDKMFPGKMTPKSLVARVGFTAMCALPFNAAFFTYATCSHLLLEEMNMRRNNPAHVVVIGDLEVLIRQMATETKLKLEREYLSTVVDSYQLWVPFNTINFAFVPPHLRMVALSVTTVFWNCYLSLAQHRDIPLPDYYIDGNADAPSTSIVGGGSGDQRLVG